MVRGRHRLYPDCPLPGRERFHNRIGRIAFGWLSDRIGSVWSYRAAVLTCAAASLGFAANERPTVIAVIVGLLGFGIGGVSAELIAVSVDLLGTRAAGP